MEEDEILPHKYRENEQLLSYETETENEEQEQQEVMEEQLSLQAPTAALPDVYEEDRKSLPNSSQRVSISSPSKNIVDPDERYLMSCLPAFKRFTPQQKAYVRMGIEKLFYEVEFENVSEPKSKRAKLS